jgi:hypothetical protein
MSPRWAKTCDWNQCVSSCSVRRIWTSWNLKDQESLCFLAANSVWSIALLVQNFTSIGTSKLKAQRWVGWIFIYEEQLELSNEYDDDATNYWPNTKIKAGFNWLFTREESMLFRYSMIDDVFTRVLNYHYSPVTIFSLQSTALVDRAFSFEPIRWYSMLYLHSLLLLRRWLSMFVCQHMYLEDAKGSETSLVASEIDKKISSHFNSSCPWYCWE